MKTRFTKGKWIETIHDYIKGEIFIYCNEKPIIRIAINNYSKKSEAKANAKLISAAPDLFEALINIENDDNRIPSTIWEMRNKAINKALGDEIFKTKAEQLFRFRIN